MGKEFLPKGGNYKELLSYRKAEIVFDITFRFCHKFLKKGDRTVDQMIQAARSGKQNIAEGSKASTLEELLVDYQDHLRVRDLRMWEKDSKEASFVRKLAAKRESNFEDFREFVETRGEDVVANIALCVIHQTNYLLDHQIAALQSDFVEHGGIRERMSNARREYRDAR
jgi:four helix bundle suffix protein